MARSDSEPFLSYFDNEVLQIVKVQRDFTEATNLTEDEKLKIKSHFQQLKEHNQEIVFFHVVKNSADLASIEKILNFIKMECYPEGNMYLSLRLSIKDQKMRQWTYDHLNQGIGYKIEKCIQRYASPLHHCLHKLQRTILPIGLCLKAIISVYLDIFKDLAIFFGLKIYTELLFVSAYQNYLARK